MKNISKYIAFALTLSATAYAQVPVPAQPQQKPVLITGATVHVGNGTTIENGAIVFVSGKITYAGPTASAPTDRSGYEVIDASGKHVYPGFILTNSQLGLEEISAVRATVDSEEKGDLNPNVRSLIAYNTDSEIIPTYRFNGILLAEIAPSGGMISGTSSVVQLDGWNWEDATHTRDVAIHMTWPEMIKTKYDYEMAKYINEPNLDYGKKVETLGVFFKDAVAFGKTDAKPANLKLEAMQGLFNGAQSLIIHASSAREIIEAVTFSQNQGVKRVTVMASDEALKVAAFLKENSIPVIIPMVHDLPKRDDDDIDMPYALPGLLSKAGVMVAFSHTGMLANGRSLPFYAGTAIAYGMDKEEALKGLTLNPAKILGIDKVAGSLEAGKDATLFISEGDALDIRTNKLTEAFIAGKKIILNNKQQDLYEKYSKKYGHKK